MPQAYVRKLAKEHGVSTSRAESHWARAKDAAEKEGHADNYGYITSIFKKMMHESAYVPSLKDLTRGMSFKYFLVSEADGDMAPQQQRSAAWQRLEKFPQFGELPFKARRELEKDATELVDNWAELSPEEQESVEDHLHDMVIDKMQDLGGTGVNVGDWSATDHSDEDATDDELSQEEPRRKERAPSHIAAMRGPHNMEMPTDADEEPDSDDNTVIPSLSGGQKKTFYKPWAALSDEQRTGRAALAKKHGLAYRISKAGWFRKLDPESQSKVMSAIKSGSSSSAEHARGLLNGPGPVTEGMIMKLLELMDLEDIKKHVDPKEMKKRVIKAGGNPFGKSKAETKKKLKEAMDLAMMKKQVDPKEMKKRIIKTGGNPFASRLRKKFTKK